MCTCSCGARPMNSTGGISLTGGFVCGKCVVRRCESWPDMLRALRDIASLCLTLDCSNEWTHTLSVIKNRANDAIASAEGS